MVEPKQNNVEVSMATAAAEEAPGKGSVDGIVEVQAVTESSGSLQPKSLKGPASDNSDIRQRFRSTEKPSTLEPVVSEESLHSSKAGDLSPKKAAENAGVDRQLGRLETKILKALRDAVSAAHRAKSPRQMTGYEKLGSQQETMKDDMEDDRSSESPVVTGGTTDTENSNPSQENAESSCKSKTAEWALLVTSVVLEATSAIFEQLGYALTGMVMAFVALLLSILDLILKARERGTTCDGRGLLPCFYRQSSHDVRNRKPFASLVQYFGLAGALWQCCFTTVGYHYTHHKLVNPIKLCLLPFILSLCVLISKVVKSSQHER